MFSVQKRLPPTRLRNNVENLPESMILCFEISEPSDGEERLSSVSHSGIIEEKMSSLRISSRLSTDTDLNERNFSERIFHSAQLHIEAFFTGVPDRRSDVRYTSSNSFRKGSLDSSSRIKTLPKIRECFYSRASFSTGSI